MNSVHFNPDLSIIIPVYNSGKYIARCLDSIIKSGLPLNNIEIIIINDGSTDNSLHIIKSEISKFPNHKLISQANQGAGAARNTGIKNSVGQYIWFIDSDDYINTSANKMLDDIIHIKSDIFIINRLYQDIKTNQLKSAPDNYSHFKHNKILNGRNVVLKNYYPGSVCITIFKRDFLISNNLEFKTGTTHEDVEFTFRTFCLASTVFFSNYSQYIIVRNPDSVSYNTDESKMIKFLLDELVISDSIYIFAFKFKDDAILFKKILNFANSIKINLCTRLILYNDNLCISEKGKQYIINELENKRIFPLQKPYFSWKQRIVAKFINFIWYLKKYKRYHNTF